jgi:hypothetical protein
LLLQLQALPSVPVLARVNPLTDCLFLQTLSIPKESLTYRVSTVIQNYS